MTDPTHDSDGARRDRQRHPGYSHCLRCGYTWATVETHVTHYTDSEGCFPLCEDCWRLLGHPEARIEYYGMLIDLWERTSVAIDPEKRAAIGRAVANGA